MSTVDLYKFSKNDLLDFEIENEILKHSTKILNKKLVIQSTEKVLQKKFALIGSLEFNEYRKQRSLERRLKGTLKKWRFLSLSNKNIITAKIYESRDYRELKINMKFKILYNDIRGLQTKLNYLNFCN